MGIDLIRGGRIASRGFRKTKSSNAYLQSLIKVFNLTFSFIPSWLAELTPSSIRSSIRDSINRDSIAIPYPSPELSSILQAPRQQFLKEKLNSTHKLSPSSAASQMMLDCSMSLKDSEFALWNSHKLLKTEFIKLRVLPTLLISWLNWLHAEREFCCWEVHGIERPRGISVCILVKKVLTQLLACVLRVVSSREPEVEDDRLFKLF